jgi:hypothetical protein
MRRAARVIRVRRAADWGGARNACTREAAQGVPPQKAICHDRRPLRRDLRAVPLGGSRALQHRRCMLRALGAGPGALCAVLGGRVGREHGVHVLGFAAAGEPAVQRAASARHRPRRQGGADAAAAPRDGRRAHRRLSARRRGRTAVVPVRPGGARLPARELGDESGTRRSAVAAESRTDPRRRTRGDERHRCRRRERVVRRPVRSAAGARRRSSNPSRRGRATLRCSSTRAGRRVRRRAR